MLRSATHTQQLEDLSNLIGIEDRRRLLAEVARKERSKVGIDEKTGLMQYEDSEPEEMGDIHVGPRIEVRQVERDDSPKLPTNGNGTIPKLLLGGALALALGGGAGLIGWGLSQASKPDPPATVQPVEPPETRVFLK